MTAAHNTTKPSAVFLSPQPTSSPKEQISRSPGGYKLKSFITPQRILPGNRNGFRKDLGKSVNDRSAINSYWEKLGATWPLGLTSRKIAVASNGGISGMELATEDEVRWSWPRAAMAMCLYGLAWSTQGYELEVKLSSWFYPFIAMWPWASHLLAPKLIFLICKLGLRMVHNPLSKTLGCFRNPSCSHFRKVLWSW